MKILYDTKTYVVFEKLPGMESESITREDVYGTENPKADFSGTDFSETDLLGTDLSGGRSLRDSGGTADKLYCVHRLDKEVGGVTVYAKDEKTAALLSRGFQDHTITKTYLALVEGCPEPAEGEMEDLLFHDRRTNKTFVVERERKGVKKASLSYEVLQKGIAVSTIQRPGQTGGAIPAAGAKMENRRTACTDSRTGVSCSLVKIRLHTGRTHQIRIQFASRKLPLAGDQRYGAKTKRTEGIGLWSYELKMVDPETGEEKLFTSVPLWNPASSLRA